LIAARGPLLQGAVERAERNLTLSSMEKLAKALDVEVKALLAAP
jgi:hypothetical protein